MKVDETNAAIADTQRQAAPAKSSNWVRRAVRRLRDFAYAEEPVAGRAAYRRPKVGLALGGGFARGIAHLGVLHMLEQKKIPIDYIAGTSAGALAGLAFASGLPFDKILHEASALRFGNFGQWRFSRMGLASNRKLADYPKEHLGVTNFSDLRIPLSMSATDLITGEAVYFTKGPLGLPLCASCAYPGLFRPVEYENRLLVDGFLSAALPIDGARAMGADMVIAVFMEAEVVNAPQNVVDVIGRSFSIARLQSDAGWQAKADIVIRPRVQDFAWDDFARTSEMVIAGEEAALAAIPQIHARMRVLSEMALPPNRVAEESI